MPNKVGRLRGVQSQKSSSAEAMYFCCDDKRHTLSYRAL